MRTSPTAPSRTAFHIVCVVSLIAFDGAQESRRPSLSANAISDRACSMSGVSGFSE